MELTIRTTGSDHALVERAQRGDRQAFGELVLRHDRRLRALARRLVRDADLADDALQDAYLKVRGPGDVAVANVVYDPGQSSGWHAHGGAARGRRSLRRADRL